MDLKKNLPKIILRVLGRSPELDLVRLMQEIKVDSYGIKIMLPKAQSYLIKIDSVSNIAANILKQEMLSLGADVAVARGALTGAVKTSACLLMGTRAQLDRLSEKLNKQPFSLGKLGEDLSCVIKNYQRDNFVLDLGKHKLNLGRRTHIMGIVNVTNDSFSGDGLSSSCAFDHALKMIQDGADIIDVGGESSRPGAKPVSVKEELKRVVPLINKLAKKTSKPISIDTYKPEVAKAALDNGAVIINDISGLRNPQMSKLAAKYKAAVVIMHMAGVPRTMQQKLHYKSVIGDIISYLNSAVDRAVNTGVLREKIIIDPGIGFGKTVEHNLEILNHLSEFKVLGRPILVGPSRKSFIGKIINKDPQERLSGTISTCVLAANKGAKILRVHDVVQIKEALKVSSAIKNEYIS